jgi:hypothetical protein
MKSKTVQIDEDAHLAGKLALLYSDDRTLSEFVSKAVIERAKKFYPKDRKNSSKHGQ